MRGRCERSRVSRMRCGVFKILASQLKRQRTLKQAPYDWATCREGKVRIKVPPVSLRVCHIVRVLEGTLRRQYRNVTTIDRKTTRHQSAARAAGGKL